MNHPEHKKGRGAQINPGNRFNEFNYDTHPLEVTEENPDEFGYILGEIRKGHKYIGNDQWQKQ